MRLPKSWNEITVGQFQECYFVLGKNPTIEHWCRVIAVLSGLTEAEVESMLIKKLKQKIIQINFLQHPNLNERVKRYIYLNGTVYRSVYQPNELTVSQIKQLKTNQAIDIKTFCSPPEKVSYQDNIVEQAHKLLASIYVPLSWRGFKYDGSKHSKASEDFRSARMGDVYGTLFFYSRVYNALMQSIQDCGVKAKEDMTPHMEEVYAWAIQEGILEDDGDGKLRLTKSLEEIQSLKTTGTSSRT